MASYRSVRVRPGATVFTRTPGERYPAAKPVVGEWIAALRAQRLSPNHQNRK